MCLLVMPPYSCVLVPTVTVVCADVLWLPSPNYARVVPCDNCNINATATITVFLMKICVKSTRLRKLRTMLS